MDLPDKELKDLVRKSYEIVKNRRIRATGDGYYESCKTPLIEKAVLSHRKSRSFS